MFLKILKIAGAVLTILTGLVSVFWPERVLNFTGLAVQGPRGITEIRTVLGAVFLGLGAVALYTNRSETYVVLGIVYLVMAVVRGVSIFVDGSADSSNWISLGFELVFGIILVL